MKTGNKAACEKWRRSKGMKPRIQPLEVRLLAGRLITPSGCWEWKGACHKNGYASTTTGKRGSRQYVHRLSYTEFVGPIQHGFDLDHLCRNRRCFNPDHLQPVTRQENIIRGIGPKILGQINGSKTHCKQGHEFNEANTIYRKLGGRRCRACEKARQLS